jgi:hypothetical protein
LLAFVISDDKRMPESSLHRRILTTNATYLDPLNLTVVPIYAKDQVGKAVKEE